MRLFLHFYIFVLLLWAELFLNDANSRAKNPNHNTIAGEGEYQEQEINKRKGYMPQSSGCKERAPMRMHEVRVFGREVPSKKSFLQRLHISVIQKYIDRHLIFPGDLNLRKLLYFWSVKFPYEMQLNYFSLKVSIAVAIKSRIFPDT